MCEHKYTSAEGDIGNFSSPGYPDPYPTYVYCRYIFVGKPDERINITFVEFDLEPGTNAGFVSGEDVLNKINIYPSGD